MLRKLMAAAAMPLAAWSSWAVAADRPPAAALAAPFKVEADGKPRRTEALNSYERRIVHMVVSEHPALETYSVGEGADRRVTIAPRRAPGSGGDPAEPPRD